MRMRVVLPLSVLCALALGVSAVRANLYGAELSAGELREIARTPTGRTTQKALIDRVVATGRPQVLDALAEPRRAPTFGVPIPLLDGMGVLLLDAPGEVRVVFFCL